MSDPIETPAPPVTDLSLAPFVYFDVVPTYGTMNGAIQVELAARIIHPTTDGSPPVVSFIGTAHLRCSPVAAQELANTLQKAVEMFQEIAAGGAPSGVAVN